MEQVAQWHFEGDVAAATQSMKATKYGMRCLYHLDTIPSVEPEENKDLVTEAAAIPLAGEVHQFWSISDPDSPDSDPLPLPSWFQLPIDNLLLTWRSECRIWDRRIKERQLAGYDQLTPKMQENYQKWLSEPTRVLVLDKVRKAVVTRPSEKSERTLKKTCLLLVVHPSLQPEDLWIKSGSGKRWSLRLLEGSQELEVPIPEEVDHFAGWRFYLHHLDKYALLN